MTDTKFKIQGGPRNATTDPETGLRFYRWRGVEYPSVTSLRRMAGLPHGLHQWALGRVISHAIGHAPDIAYRMAAASDHAAIEAVIRTELRRAATAERDAAAALGIAVHDAAATGREIAEVDEALQPRLAQYLDWLEKSKAQILATEFQVFNPSVGYAGTVDLLCRFPNKSIWVLDIKTGKGIYPEHALQLIAYYMAEFSGYDDVIDDDITRFLKGADGIGILHLSDDAWEFRAVRADQETWYAFRGLLLFSRWLYLNEKSDQTVIGKRTGMANIVLPKNLS